jgi:Raf kinase inhibitor-like YbhB/YbcL family protein
MQTVKIRNSPSGLSAIITPDYSAFCIGYSIRASFGFMTIFPPKNMRFAAWLFTCLVAAAFAEQKNNFQVRVSGLGPNGQIPNDFALNQFGCQGKNLSPEIAWSGAPAETKSFALAVLDSDAPKEGGFYHWMIVNIPVSAHSLPAGTGNLDKRRAPAGSVQLKNDYGEPGYGGPCPPGHELHHYHFLLYALKTEHLPVDQRTAPGTAAAEFQKEVLAKAEVVATYHR